jgi:hypothetical protein
MYKTIKISEKAYRNAETLKREMAEDVAVKGVRKVTLSEAISAAVRDALETRDKKKHLMAAAGSWADLDCNAMLKDIYSSRINSSREIVL